MAGTAYLEKFKSMLLGTGWFSQEQIARFISLARGYAGGTAKGQKARAAQDMGGMMDMTPADIRKMPNPDMIKIHSKVHDLCQDCSADEAAMLKNKHGMMVKEMIKRELPHKRRDWLDGMGPMPKPKTELEAA